MVVSMLSVVFIRNSENADADQLLLLLCETGEHNLDYYFDSVQKSVGKIATAVEDDLNGLDDERLQSHVDRMEQFFEETAYKTNGVLTYYYRIDPEVSDTVKGFWYTDLDGKGFTKHEVTDITEYDTQDTTKLVWFTVPKHTGKPVWLPPYITDNLDKRVISYNVPIYWKNQFVGVVGIEIDYSTMAEQVESIRLYKNGYAFLDNENGDLFYHPYIDVATLTEETMPTPPAGVVSDSTFFRYTYDGVEKRAAWLPLSNGMRLNVAVPISETDGNWQTLLWQIFGVSVLVLLALGSFILFYTGRITRPLEELTQAADQVDKGNYDFTLDYNGDDEVGRLTSTFKRLAHNMEENISDLSNRVYVDSLTSVKNKGAFADAINILQRRLEDDNSQVEYAIGIFDCDNLKIINDRYGHDKGDVYLKTSCHLICRVFEHSPVFRIGGDEFAVILQGHDYECRDELVERFYKACDDNNESAMNAWERSSVTVGIATYDQQTDRYANDTVRRADKIMYANKRKRKQSQQDHQ